MDSTVSTGAAALMAVRVLLVGLLPVKMIGGRPAHDVVKERFVPFLL